MALSELEAFKEMLSTLEIHINGTLTFNLKDSSVQQPVEPPIETEPSTGPPDPEPTNKTTVWTQDFKNTPIQSPYSKDQIKQDFPWETYKNGRNSYVDPNDYVSIIEKDGKKVMKNSYGPGHWGVGLAWETGGNEGNGTGVNIYSVMSKDSGWDELYLSYNIFFEDGFEWGLGGKMPGFASIPGPTGLVGPKEDEGTFALMMWQPGGKMKYYCYFHEDFEYQYGRGPVIPSVLQTGKWTNITIRLVQSSPWAKDGLMEIFVDGVLDFTWNNISTREKEEIKLSVVTWNTFQGGGDSSYATPGDCAALVNGIEVFYLTGDDVVTGKVPSPPGRDITEYLTYWPQ